MSEGTGAAKVAPFFTPAGGHRSMIHQTARAARVAQPKAHETHADKSDPDQTGRTFSIPESCKSHA